MAPRDKKSKDRDPDVKPQDDPAQVPETLQAQPAEQENPRLKGMDKLTVAIIDGEGNVVSKTEVTPKEYSTGSIGWMAAGREMFVGTTKVNATIQLVISGSKKQKA